MPLPGRTLRGITCQTTSLCIAVGNGQDSEGAILTSADSGGTWQGRS
jgi:hypothetical protein